MPIHLFPRCLPDRPRTRGRWNYPLAFLVLAFIAAPSGAQIPAGDRFLLNDAAPSFVAELRPSIAALDDGFVAVWWSDLASETGYRSIEGRRFRADGSFLGAQFQINPFIGHDAHDLPDVAALAGGGFIVVWNTTTSNGDDTSFSSIQARHFNNDGTPTTPMFQVNAFTTGEQMAPRVAATSAGGFVVVWNSDASDNDNSDRSVRARRFDAGFNPSGAEFQVNTYSTGGQFYPVVANLASDDFVITWHSDGSTGNDDFYKSVQARRFTSNGDPIGHEFQVNTYTSFNQSYTSVAPTQDGYIVVWMSEGSLGNDNRRTSIQARRFRLDGEPIGSEFQVNTYTTGGQEIPDIHVFPRGEFVIAWHSSDPYGGRIGTRQFLADGTPVAAEIEVGYPLQFGPRSRLRVGGSATEFVIAWDDYDYPPPTDVSARGYKSAVIFTDGFESGDTSGWAMTTP